MRSWRRLEVDRWRWKCKVGGPRLALRWRGWVGRWWKRALGCRGMVVGALGWWRLEFDRWKWKWGVGPRGLEGGVLCWWRLEVDRWKWTWNTG